MRTVYLAGLLLGLLLSADTASAQLSQSDARALQLGAVRQLWAVDSTRVLCVGLSTRAPNSLSYGDAGTLTPDSAFLAALGSAKHFRPRSACRVESGGARHTVLTKQDALPASLVEVSAPAVIADSGYVRLTVQRMNGGRSGGEWTCQAELRAGAELTCRMFKQY